MHRRSQYNLFYRCGNNCSCHFCLRYYCALYTEQPLQLQESSSVMHYGTCRHYKNDCVSRTNPENSAFSVNTAQTEELIASINYKYYVTGHPHEKYWSSSLIIHKVTKMTRKYCIYCKTSVQYSKVSALEYYDYNLKYELKWTKRTSAFTLEAYVWWIPFKKEKSFPKEYCLITCMCSLTLSLSKIP